MITRRELDNLTNTTLFSKGVVRPKVANEEALKAIHQTPHKTVWGWDFGRPIYDRLPAITEQYKKGYEGDQAYVYLDPRSPAYEGPGSSEVVAFLDRPNVLAAESGTITWKMGQLSTPGFEVDIDQALEENTRFPDGQYQVGYELSYEVPTSDSPIEGYALAHTDGSTLGKANIAVAASGGSELHEVYQAINKLARETSWWPGATTDAGRYWEGSWLVMDFMAPVTPERFVVASDPNEPDPTAIMALYFSDDAIIWHKDQQVGSRGKGWDVTVLDQQEHRYWKLFFWDGTASVASIVFSGTAYFPDPRVSGPVQTATPYIDLMSSEPPEDYILLAGFEVKSGKIGSLVDYRVFTNRKYEPVSSWVTEFQDTSLRCLFDSVTDYSELYMAPPTADYHFYSELDDNECFGLGEYTVGVGDLPIVEFPDWTDLYCSFIDQQELCDSILHDDPLDRTLSVDPGTVFLDLAIDRRNRCNGCLITPRQVILLKDPIIDSDLATYAYSEFVLYRSYSLDNGIY